MDMSALTFCEENGIPGKYVVFGLLMGEFQVVVLQVFLHRQYMYITISLCALQWVSNKSCCMPMQEKPLVLSLVVVLLELIFCFYVEVNECPKIIFIN